MSSYNTNQSRDATVKSKHLKRNSKGIDHGDDSTWKQMKNALKLVGSKSGEITYSAGEELEKFEIIRQLNIGQYGYVQLAKLIETGTPYAIKSINKEQTYVSSMMVCVCVFFTSALLSCMCEWGYFNSWKNK